MLKHVRVREEESKEIVKEGIFTYPNGIYIWLSNRKFYHGKTFQIEEETEEGIWNTIATMRIFKMS